MRKIFSLKYLYVCVLKDGKYIFIMDTANNKKEPDYDPEAATFLTEYVEFPPAMERAFKTGQLALTKEPYTDQWGTYLSAFFPVKDSSGKVQAVIGADYDIANVIKDKRKAWIALGAILLVIVAVSSAVIIAMRNILFRPLFDFIEKMNSTAEHLDLSVRFSIDRDDELGDLSRQFNFLMEKMHELVSKVIESMQELVSSTSQIASGNENLAQRTSEQAAALEEIASTVEEASSSIISGAENSIKAREISSEALESAKEGNEVIGSVIESITRINETSEKISQITSVINEIAFQTNLLALNASVEAARAGEQGRGFAVVAGEVRNLAQRAGSSAKEIETLIKDSVEKIREGTKLVKVSGDSLGLINNYVSSVTAMINEIAAMNEEQKSGMEQINKALAELDTNTQANAALVEEVANASREIHGRSQDLLSMVEQFKI
jgi:methyl-accepting chemotaxis protein